MVSVSPKIEKSSCYREISNELITSEWPMRTHNRQQMADAMPDADAVSPVIESTLSVSIMGRGRCGWLLFGIHTPQWPSGSTSSLSCCSLSAVIVNEGGVFNCYCFVLIRFTNVMFQLILIIFFLSNLSDISL